MDLAGKKEKHNKRSLASCSKPKPKHLQASKAIPSLSMKQRDALGCPQEGTYVSQSYRSSQGDAVWAHTMWHYLAGIATHRYLSLQSCVTQLHGAFKTALTLRDVKAVSSRRYCKKLSIKKRHCKLLQLPTIKACL